MPWQANIKNEKVYDQIITNIYNDIKTAKTEAMYEKLAQSYVDVQRNYSLQLTELIKSLLKSKNPKVKEEVF